MKSDRIFGALGLVVAIAMGVLATGFQSAFSYEPIGPSKYPMLLAVLLALLSSWLIVRPGPEAHWPEPALWRKIFVMFVVLFVYALLFEPVGFMLATGLLTVALGRLFAATWKHCLVGGALMGPGLFVLFDKLLDVALPIGAVWQSL
jgi:putative tricarboxylic transport membrane protein